MTKSKSTEVEKYANVWDALADSQAEAENMKVRSALMRQIGNFIKRQKLTQVEVARLCQITQPRASDLVNGRVSKFSLDALVNIAAAARLHVSITIEEEELV